MNAIRYSVSLGCSEIGNPFYIEQNAHIIAHTIAVQCMFKTSFTSAHSNVGIQGMGILKNGIVLDEKTH